jgi:DMSO/TMAO reductase YedYZ heme-binding membrane subunit
VFSGKKWSRDIKVCRLCGSFLDLGVIHVIFGVIKDSQEHITGTYLVVMYWLYDEPVTRMKWNNVTDINIIFQDGKQDCIWYAFLNEHYYQGD